MLLLLALQGPSTGIASEAPPWWFLVFIVIAICAVGLFTMRVSLSARRRGRTRACPGCGSMARAAWVLCPTCGAALTDGGAGRAARSASGGVAQIEFRSGPLAGRVFPLERDVTTVGSVQGNTVILSDTGVSRKHVGIRKLEGGYELADLGSTNGVFVNGEKIARRRLVAGDVIRIGTSEALFRDVAS